MTVKEYQKVTSDLVKKLKEGEGHVLFCIIVDGKTDEMTAVLEGTSSRILSAISQVYDADKDYQDVIDRGVGFSETFRNRTKAFHEEN